MNTVIVLPKLGDKLAIKANSMRSNSKTISLRRGRTNVAIFPISEISYAIDKESLEEAIGGSAETRPVNVADLKAYLAKHGIEGPALETDVAAGASK